MSGAKLLIPTRNRPASLAGVLEFLARFYPGTAVIVADGSAEAFRAQNRAAVERPAHALEIDYRPYDPALSLFDRILDVLEGMTDEAVIMGADDDYPQIGVLREAERALLADARHVAALGAFLRLSLLSPRRLTARLTHAHPVSAPTAAGRAQEFAEWPYPTSYGVARRTHLIERYRRARTSFVVGFVDYKTGLHDAMAGTLAIVPGISYVSTHNFRHSYLRGEDPLVFLRHAPDVLRIKEQLAADLQAIDGGSAGEAGALATRLICQRIAALVGVRPQRQPGFERLQAFRAPEVQQQIADFEALFRAGTPARRAMEARLLHITDRLKTVASSEDNMGEPALYESLAAQAASTPGAAHAPRARGTNDTAQRSAGRLRSQRGRKEPSGRKGWLGPIGGGRRAPPKVPRLRLELTLDTILRSEEPVEPDEADAS